MLVWCHGILHMVGDVLGGVGAIVKFSQLRLARIILVDRPIANRCTKVRNKQQTAQYALSKNTGAIILSKLEKWANY